MDLNNPCKILRIEDDFLSNNWQDREGSEKLFDIDVCSIEGEVDELRKTHNLPIDITKGDTLIRSPFDKKTYWRIEDYENNVISGKASIMLEIAQLLGAKHYHFECNLESIEERCNKFDMKGQYKVVKVTTSVKTEEEEKLKKQYNETNDFPNGYKCPTQEEYDKAKSIAVNSGLYGENDVKVLLDLCEPSKRNRIGERKVSFSVSTETNKAFDIAFNLNIMSDKFDLNDGFQRSIQYVKSMQMAFVFKFPDDIQ